jgi:hypothetical protein
VRRRGARRAREAEERTRRRRKRRVFSDLFFVSALERSVDGMDFLG